MKLDEVFRPNGLLANHFPDYEQRLGQVQMATLIESSINEQKSCVIEGATGIGKSFAYLIPLILSKNKAVISTSNKSLQDQLSNKDLPSLKKILPVDFNWAVLKGKNNYFCHERFRANESDIWTYFKRTMDSPQAKLKMKEILDWAKKTEDGDIEYYPGYLPEPVREMITCSTSTIHERQSVYSKMCFAVKAKDKAADAQIILVNHTLLALDIALRKETEGKAKILPTTKIIIIDEAHTFERYAVLAFSDEISVFSLLHLLKWKIVRDSLGYKDKEHLFDAFNNILRGFLPAKSISGYYQQERVLRFDGMEKVIALLERLIDKVNNNEKIKRDEMVDTKIREITKEARNLINRLEALGKEDDNMLRWSEALDGKGKDPIVKLKSVPIDVSNLLERGLFEDHIVVCTSATLAVNKSFDFFRYQIGVPSEAKELIVNSPFNFRKNCLIYIAPGEHEKRYEIEELLSFSRGRAFILFTSYKDMEYFYETIETPYPKMIQNNGISRVQLLAEFKNTPNAILFATKSFWEGVDVRGDKLSLVIVHKLPFETPGDLVYSSKIDRIDKKYGKGKHWVKFTIPDMCLKLKQGIGRLIRSTTDVGVIAILDSRINFQNYGKAVINTLPPAKRTSELKEVKKFFKEINE